MELKRGDLVIVSAAGDFGKPRPAVVVQADVLNQTDTGSVVLALVTSTLREAPLLRLDLAPRSDNGLHKPSQVMVDKLQTVRRERVGECIGRLSEKELVALNRLLAFVVGLG